MNDKRPNLKNGKINTITELSPELKEQAEAFNIKVPIKGPQFAKAFMHFLIGSGYKIIRNEDYEQLMKIIFSIIDFSPITEEEKKRTKELAEKYGWK